MIKLARKLDISDVGLAKACRRHNIPRPPRGYWAKLAAGKALPEHSREWLRPAVHLARLTDPTKARLEALQAGISGCDYNMPFGRSVVG